MVLKIESAEDGNVFYIREEESIEKVKSELSFHQSIPSQDQILLYGPPFKVLDSHYSPRIELENKRIFLYDRSVLQSDNETLRKYLFPDYSGLFQAANEVHIDESEVFPYFQTTLNKAIAFDQFISESLASFRKCLSQLRVQHDALHAGLESMKTIFDSNRKTFNQLQSDYEPVMERHLELFSSFERSLLEFSKIELHPDVISHLTEKLSDLSSIPRNLLDCVPIEREMQYFRQCKDTHTKVDEGFEQCARQFVRLQSSIDEICSSLQSWPNCDEIQENIEEILSLQMKDISTLRDHYHAVYNAIHVESSEKDQSSLNSEVIRRKEQVQSENCIGLMMDRCQDILNLRRQLEELKDSCNKKVVNVLRRIGTVQSEIQYKIRREIDWLKRWLNAGGDGFYKHLCQVLELPIVYRNLLKEISRRNAYEKSIVDKIQKFHTELSLLRDAEIRSRESFMKDFGVYLPSLLAQGLPSLKEKPLAITVDYTPQDDLPNFVLETEETELAPLIGKINDEHAEETGNAFLLRKLDAIISEILLSRSQPVEGEASTTLEEILSKASLLRDSSSASQYPVITFMDFKVGDVALFMPAYVNNCKIWMAFNSGFPYRFLSEESLEIFLRKGRGKEQRASIIGKIFSIETKVADSDDNKFNIPRGTEYYVCHAEPLYRHVVFGQNRKHSAEKNNSYV